MLRRVAALLAMFLGFLGVVACVLGIYAVWWVGSRLDRANDKVMAAVDRRLTDARDRVLGVQQRVQESRLTSDEIGEQVRDRTAKQATERIMTRLEIEGKTDKLALKLQQADLLLEIAAESIRGVQQLLEASNPLGAPADVAWPSEVLEQLLSLRTGLQQAKETVDGIREFTAKFEDAGSQEAQRSRVIQVIARVIVMISGIETRLGEVANRFTELRSGAEQLRTRTSGYIAFATIVGFLLFVWMAVGQAALCRYGWKNCRRSGKGVLASGSSPA